jgi:hypothetical protein
MEAVIVGLIVAGAVLYVGRRIYRAAASARAAKAGECAGGCCSPSD